MLTKRKIMMATAPFSGLFIVGAGLLLQMVFAEPSTNNAPASGQVQPAKRGDLPVRLQWKIMREPYYVEMTTTTERHLTAYKQKRTERRTESFCISFRLKGKDKDGNWVVEQTIHAIKARLQTLDHIMEYDSARLKVGTTGLDRFGQRYVGLVGLRSTFTIDLKKRGSGLPGMLGFPSGFVKKGDSWTEKVSHERELSIDSYYELTYNYTYDGKDGKERNLDRIVIKPSLRYVQPPDKIFSMPIKIVKNDLRTTKATGLALFDNKNGQLVQMEVDLRREGTLTVLLAEKAVVTIDLDETEQRTVRALKKAPALGARNRRQR